MSLFYNLPSGSRSLTISHSSTFCHLRTRYSPGPYFLFYHLESRRGGRREDNASSSWGNGHRELRCHWMATPSPPPLFDSPFVGAEKNHPSHKDVIYARACHRVAIVHQPKQLTAWAAGEKRRPPEGSSFREAI